MTLRMRVFGIFVVLLLSSRGEAAAPPLNFIVLNCDNLGYGDTEPFLFIGWSLYSVTR